MNASLGIVDSVLLCLKGNISSRLYLENLIIADDFFVLIINVLDSKNERDVLLFLFSMISKRMKLSYVDTNITSVLSPILLNIGLNSPNDMPLYRSISACLSLIVLKSNLSICTNTMKSIANSFQNNHTFLLTFLTEIAEGAIITDQQRRRILKGSGEDVLSVCERLLKEFNPDESESLVIAVVKCINAWLKSDLIKPSILVQPSPSYSNNEPTQSILELLCVYSSVTYRNILSSIAELFDTIVSDLMADNELPSNLTEIPYSNNFRNENLGSSSAFENNLTGNGERRIVPVDVIESMLLILIPALLQHTLMYQQAIGNPDWILPCMDFIRIVSYAARILPPPMTSEQTISLLQLLLLGTQHPSLKVASIALEAWPEVIRKLSKEKRRNVPSLRALFTPLYAACVHHSCRPANIDDPADDSSLDENDWLALREQAVGPVILICYYELRASTLLELLDGIGQAVASQHDLHQACSAVEGRLFVIRTLAFDVSKRALLNGANNVALFNASKASSSLEKVEEVAEDARHTAVMLKRLLSGLLQAEEFARTAPQSVGVFSTPGVLSEACRVVGMLSSWLGKEKAGPDDDITAIMSGDTGRDGRLLERAFMLLLQALRSPRAIYSATKALRSVCQQCASKILSMSDSNGQPALMQPILMAWHQVCELRLDGLSKEDVDAMQSMVVEEGTDVIQESSKAVVQAICHLLKPLPAEVSTGYLEQLMTPPLAKLQSGLKSVAVSYSESNLSQVSKTIDIIAMVVRSVRLPPSESGQRDLDVESEDMKRRVQRHPAVLIINALGEAFVEMRNLRPSATVGASVVYLMTSLVTFVSPVMAKDTLPDFLRFTWEQHTKSYLAVNFAATADFVVEAVDIIGPIGESEARLVSNSSGNSNAEAGTVSRQIGAHIRLCLVDMLTSLFSYANGVLDLTNLFPGSSMNPVPVDSTFTTIAAPPEALELWECLIGAVSRSLGTAPLVVVSLPFLAKVVEVAKFSMNLATHPLLARTSTLFLSTLVSATEHHRQPASIEVGDYPVWQVHVLQTLQLLETQFVSSAQFFCFTQLMGVCSEILVDVYGSLLYSLLRRGCLSSVDGQLFMAQVSQTATQNGSAHCSEDTLAIALNICSHVRPMDVSGGSVLGDNQSHQQPQFTKSEFLEFCGSLWKVGSGQSNVEVLQLSSFIKSQMAHY